MSKLNVEKVDSIINEIEKLLKKNEKEIGVKFELSGGRYDDDSFKTTLKVSLPNAKTEEEKALDHELKVRERNKSWMKPLDSSKIAELITSKGKVKYKLFGFRPRASARPFIVSNLNDNKRYLMTEERAEMLFADPKWKSDVNAKNYTPTFKHEVK